jgi:hypothetical protein
MQPLRAVLRVSVASHVSLISMVEVWTMVIGGRRRWPFDAGELIVFIADVAVGGHSASEFTVGARSHRFLLNSESARLSPTWHANYQCFVNQTIKLI